MVKNESWSTERQLRAQGAKRNGTRNCVELYCARDAELLDTVGVLGMFFGASFPLLDKSSRPLCPGSTELCDMIQSKPAPRHDIAVSINFLDLEFHGICIT